MYNAAMLNEVTRNNICNQVRLTKLQEEHWVGSRVYLYL